MPLTTQDYEKVCVIGLGQDLAGDEASSPRAAVEQAIEQRQIVDIVIDFTGCGFIDSHGLETLLWIKRRCDQEFGRMKLINLDDNCRKVLEITRLEPKFESSRDLAGALKSMR
jgi:anti-anti-sigma factor